MANVARLGSWNMGCRLTGRVGAVVTGRACARLNANVGKRGWIPVRSGVANVARLRGWNMRRRFDLGVNRRVRATVASNTVAG